MTEEFDNAIRQIALALYEQVNSEMREREWVRSVLDVRFVEDSTSWLSKIRVITHDGKTIAISACNEIDLPLINLNTQRSSLGPEWFGMLMTVDSDRKCELELIYDQDCAEDQTFFDD